MPAHAQFTSAIAAVSSGKTNGRTAATTAKLSILDQISENLRRSLARPFCPKCNLSQTDDGGLCDHCKKTKLKKADKLKAFLDAKQQQQEE